ncbi:unnamed protein product [Fusarium graminearum]|uniref:Uncharacterized protein n=1 Tax=Gibberella zeae TaxID=5518 RepID=A0A4E9D7C4_GIBZA|nr:unnamed protein product [Fusarium graminearum]CAF3560397.1 unnamed protein product [Fusarium graminearum]CAG1960794.1 unnamed protein product [Fusarium graminearum]
MNSLRDGRVKKDVVMMASCYRYRSIQASDQVGGKGRRQTVGLAEKQLSRRISPHHPLRLLSPKWIVMHSLTGECEAC